MAKTEATCLQLSDSAYILYRRGQVLVYYLMSKHFQGAFFVILRTSLALLFTYCRYKSTVAKLSYPTDIRVPRVRIFFYSVSLNVHYIEIIISKTGCGNV
jgi:hypothetical protein